MFVPRWNFQNCDRVILYDWREKSIIFPSQRLADIQYLDANTSPSCDGIRRVDT